MKCPNSQTIFHHFPKHRDVQACLRKYCAVKTRNGWKRIADPLDQHPSLWPVSSQLFFLLLIPCSLHLSVPGIFTKHRLPSPRKLKKSLDLEPATSPRSEFHKRETAVSMLVTAYQCITKCGQIASSIPSGNSTYLLKIAMFNRDRKSSINDQFPCKFTRG